MSSKTDIFSRKLYSMPGGCEIAKPGPGKTSRTPCGRDENAENCGKCPFWGGPKGNGRENRRGGVETPRDSFLWRIIARNSGVATNGE